MRFANKLEKQAMQSRMEQNAQQSSPSSCKEARPKLSYRDHNLGET